MPEIWKPIPGFELLYKISNYGNVFSVRKNRVLIPYREKCGYCRVQLCKKGEKVRHFVHRLVAISFIGDQPPEHEVNHIDYDRTNNHVGNLEWVTHKENMRHSKGRLADVRGEAHGAAKLTKDEVAEIRKRYADGGISFVKLGAIYGICGQQCHRIVRGSRWSHI